MTDTITITARVADLWRDECGWSENAAWAHETSFVMPADASDAAIVRRVKRELGIVGMRRDDWCDADFGPWRDGAIGAYADITD